MGSEFGTVSDSGLRQCVGDVSFDGLPRQEEVLRDFGIARALGDQAATARSRSVNAASASCSWTLARVRRHVRTPSARSSCSARSTSVPAPCAEASAAAARKVSAARFRSTSASARPRSSWAHTASSAIPPSAKRAAMRSSSAIAASVRPARWSSSASTASRRRRCHGPSVGTGDRSQSSSAFRASVVAPDTRERLGACESESIHVDRPVVGRRQCDGLGEPGEDGVLLRRAADAGKPVGVLVVKGDAEARDRFRSGLTLQRLEPGSPVAAVERDDAPEVRQPHACRRIRPGCRAASSPISAAAVSASRSLP